MSAGVQRLFFALWPDAAVRARIEAVARDLPLRAGRRIPAPNLHATLVFLGAADRTRRACIERAAAGVRAAGFALALTQVAARGRLVWLTAEAVPPELERLVAALESACGACGHAPEPRPYALHVTLARDAALNGRGYAVAPIEWRAAEFCLVSSRATARGSEYTVEARWPLA